MIAEPDLKIGTEVYYLDPAGFDPVIRRGEICAVAYSFGGLSFQVRNEQGAGWGGPHRMHSSYESALEALIKEGEERCARRINAEQRAKEKKAETLSPCARMRKWWRCGT
jgi:hypothetical protein